jgi:3-hydroxyacyl-CoA dehydrogenase/3a,7a,12a-trihydroxy-5b-cholest-24-enoyl-CoA hydratase
MANDLRFDGRVAIVTGAGGGLGRSHALLLGKRGARVVVNDLGGSMRGGGQSSTPAQAVVDEIKAAGGEAIANFDSVEDGGKIVRAAMDTWGRIDIVVNNAGILRDTSFQKLGEEDWDLVYRVHVLGGFRVTRAAWNHMRDAGYGRIVFTASAAGIYGNFGQANYAMAKLGLVGLSNTLAIEGRKRGVLVNTIAPIAGSRLTETVLPKELLDALRPEYVSPLVAVLCHESSTETGGLFEVGGGYYAKLRWERTAGKKIKLGKAIEPEALAAAWPEITSFEKTDHPADITSSMAPVIENIGSKSRGGNEFIDVDAALGYEFPPLTTEYTERDLALYALGVGAGTDPLDVKDLQYVYELHGDGFRSLPTYSVVPVINSILEHAKQGKQAPGLSYGFDRILHGEQYTEAKRPLPAHQKLVHRTRIANIWDKGKHAVVVFETRSYDEADQELAYNEITMVVRGAGGWGGERGPTGDGNAPPDRAPDAVIEQKINADQALLYRLSGDWNPLHADPAFAQAFGFRRPILHGLCTYGFAARHVVKAFAGNDARLFKAIRARFADSVFPGETLVTEMWKETPQKIVFRSTVKERNKVAISHASVELYAEVPVVKAAPKAAAAPATTATPAAAPAATAAPAALGSADVFVAIRDYIEKNADLVGKVATVFQFHLKGPDSAWTVDVKNGKGAVTAGTAAADVTLELSDDDFLAMTSGKADAQKLFMSGKLKISGNVMASQKLMFLKKVDPQAAMAAIEKARGGVAPAAAAPAAAAPAATAAPAAQPAKESRAPAVFKALGARLAATPDLASEVAAVLHVVVKDLASTWTLDLTAKPGTVSAGKTGTAATTLTLAEEDLLALVKGTTAATLHQQGKLRIDGDVRPAHQLAMFKDLV